MSLLKNLKTDFRTPDRGLVVAFFLGPVAAVSNVAVSYALASESCQRGSKAILHASSGGHFLLCLFSAFLAWRLLARFAALPPDDLRERMRWMANAAIILAIGSALVVAATEIPNLILGSCD